MWWCKSSSVLTFCLELVSVCGHSRASLKDVGDKRKLFLFPLGKQTWDQFPFANFPSRRKVPHRFLDFSLILRLFSSQLSLPLFFFLPPRRTVKPIEFWLVTCIVSQGNPWWPLSEWSKCKHRHICHVKRQRATQPMCKHWRGLYEREQPQVVCVWLSGPISILN